MGKRKFLIWSLLTTFIVLCLSIFVYFNFNGNPWKSREFAQSVERYMKATYPEIAIKHQSVSYSFKEMKYYATVITNSDLAIRISTDNDNQLVDNYYVAKWEDEVSKSVSMYINKHIDPKAKVQFFIEAQNKELKAYKDYISFVEFGDRFQDKAKLFIELGDPKEDDEKQLQECFKMVEWIVLQKYKVNIVFFFKNDPFIRIQNTDIEKIQDWKNLKDYLVWKGQ